MAARGMCDVSVSVDVAHFNQLRQELYGFDRQLLGKLNSRIRRAVKPVVDDAQARTSALATLKDSRGHRSGFARTFASSRSPRPTVKIGGGTTRSGRQSVVTIRQNNKAAAIAEFAQTPHTPQGRALIDRLARFGSPGRFLWAALDAHKDSIEQQIQDEIWRTEGEFNKRLAAGLSTGVVR